MSDAKVEPEQESAAEGIKSLLLRKDVVVIVAIGLVLVGLHFGLSNTSQGSSAQPGTQAWCVMNGQKDYRQLMREFGFTLPQSKGLIAKCAKLFEASGGQNTKIFEEQQKGMKRQMPPMATGSY